MSNESRNEFLVLPDGEAFLAKFIGQGDLRRQRPLVGHGIQVDEEVGQQAFSKPLRIPVRLMAGLMVREALFRR
jgi:hypothetical protein